MLVDTHAHLDDEQFEPIREDVLSRAAAAGVAIVVTVGTTLASSRRCVELAGYHRGLYAAVGIQPNYAAQAGPADWAEIVRLAAGDRVVALGETGLDRHWDFTPFAQQEDYFDRHLRLAQERGPAVHCAHAGLRARDAGHVAQARGRGPLRGVMHSFTGSLETARECWELGLYVSFAGMVTYRSLPPCGRSPDRSPRIASSWKPTAPICRRSRARSEVPTSRLGWSTRRPAWPRCGVWSAASFAAQTTANSRALFRLV